MQFSFPTISPAPSAARQRWRLSEDELRVVFALDVELNALGLEAWLDATARNTAR